MYSFDLQGLWQELPLAFVDLETTGRDPGRDRIVEVGIVTYRGGAVTERWGAMIHPGMPIPPDSIEIHGITDEMVQDEPPFRELAWEVYRRLRDRVLVAYNGLSFDVPFLEQEFARCGLTLPLVPVLDPMMWVYEKMPSKSGWPRSLTTVCERFGIDNPEAHRAVADCEALAGATTRLAEQVPPTLGALLEQQARWREGFLALKRERDEREAARQARADPEPPEETGQEGLF